MLLRLFLALLFSFFYAPHMCGSVDLVVFSYDRPMQLYACLESTEKYVSGLHTIHVIYRTSSPEYERGYESVKARFPTATFHRQSAAAPSDFKPLVLSSVFSPSCSCPYILFSVDDIIVTDTIDLLQCVQAMEEQKAWGFFLRMGKNITHFYMKDRPSPVPPTEELSNGMFLWTFADGVGDWRYPNTVDMTIYRKKDVRPYLETVEFTNPNSLESEWQHWNCLHMKGIAYPHSKVVNIPLNLINPSKNRNSNLYTTKCLLEKFQKRQKIDIFPLYKLDHNSVHISYRPKIVPIPKSETPARSYKTLYVVPYAPAWMPVDMYRYTPKKMLPKRVLVEDFKLWRFLDKELQKYGLRIQTTNLSEFSLLQKTLQEDEAILCIDIPNWIAPNWREILQQFPKEKLFLIAYEPPSVHPMLYQEETLCLFGTVFTWNDALVDNVKFFKYHYPDLQKIEKGGRPFSKRKLLTQIITNKKPTHPNELNTERLQVIRYFEQDPGSDFRFYGRGWAEAGFKNYRGISADKTALLQHYKFSICYENMHDIKGYVTEKIFDCFAAGCVPVYWGASNITDYIPKDCFIDRRDFQSIEELHHFLKNMKEKEYNRYLRNCRRFLKTKEAKKFSRSAFVKTIMKQLTKSNP